MSAPNILLMIQEHADEEVSDLFRELREATDRVADVAQRLAKAQAHAAVARAMNGNGA